MFGNVIKKPIYVNLKGSQEKLYANMRKLYNVVLQAEIYDQYCHLEFNREPETHLNVRPFGSSMAELVRAAALWLLRHLAEQL